MALSDQALSSLSESRVIEVQTYNTVYGFHHWPDAPDGSAFLRIPHPHWFEIRCGIEVHHSDRAIEFIEASERIWQQIQETFGTPAQFGTLSCEEIGLWMLQTFSLSIKWVQVREDGYGGAKVFRPVSK